MIELTLPFPPTLNTYWRAISRGKLAGRVLISAAGRAYREAVGQRVMLTRPKPKISGRLEVRLLIHPPDKRRRDLDNLPKSLLDALTHAGVISDDGDIDQLLIVRGSVAPPGRVVVSISEMETGFFS